MRIYKFLPLLLLAGCGFLNSCGFLNNSVVSSANLGDLFAINWTAVNLSGKPIIQGSSMSFSVTALGNVTGNAGVNRYSGHWKITGKDILSSAMVGTKMYRSEPTGIMQQEKTFLTLLSKITEWRIVDEKLQLLQDDNIMLIFENNGKTKPVK